MPDDPIHNAEPDDSPAPEPAAPVAAPDVFADFKDFIPAGTDPRDYIRQTLEVRQRIDSTPGGIDKIIYEKALEIAPSLAEEFLRGPEGHALARAIAGARESAEAGEELTPEEKRILQFADKIEAADRKASEASERASAAQMAIAQNEIASRMETEFEQAIDEQPEIEDWAKSIRRVIAAEGKADPSLISPGWVKRRSLELYGEFSGASNSYQRRVSTRGRATASAGGGQRKVNVNEMTREQAAEYAADIMTGRVVPE